MLKKTMIATGALAVTMLAVQPQAQAKSSFHVDIGIGIAAPIYNDGYSPAYWGHGYHTPNYHWSVRRILRKLRHRGYRNFRRVRNRGGFIKVKAFKFGHRYRLRVSTYNGRIISRRRMF